ncbi:hypothetical protein H4I96_03463, partial [Botrytis cinerea]
TVHDNHKRTTATINPLHHAGIRGIVGRSGCSFTRAERQELAEYYGPVLRVFHRPVRFRSILWANRQRYQPRSERRRAAAAEVPSLPLTLTNNHHRIHLTNQGDGCSVEEERDLLLFLTVHSGTPTAGGGDGAGCRAPTGANEACKQTLPNAPLNVQFLIVKSEPLPPYNGDGSWCAPPGARTPPSGARDGPSGTSLAPSGTEDHFLLSFGALRSLCLGSVSPPSGKQLHLGGRGGGGD